MTKKWYGVHTYSSFENKVKLNLQERIKNEGMAEYFEEILIPSETVVELKKGGEKRTSTRKFFPGYILIKMELNDESWHLVKETPKVTGFVGGNTPFPISEEEVAKITQRMQEGVEKPRPKVLFEVGETVRVIDGPFVSFSGIVEDVKPDKGKLRVSVTIFGRPTPIELEFIQVEKN